ncbi:hypothetical protein [Gayadomonas joobiniege]|uniref:hypothetical protein n=1 Tax=Gayadomonas joobiniege TaxID=1234606 RepID=UPI0003765303|nr:hypothetical protein [Gayadomonas joobiniege]
MSTEILDAYALVLAALEKKELQDGEFKGWLRLTPQLKDKLELLAGEELTTGSYDLIRDGKPLSSANLSQLKQAHFQNNIRFHVELTAQKIKSDYAICSEWNELLANELRVKSPVKYIFFTNTMTLLTPDCKDEKYVNYLNVHKAYEFVKELAESTEGGDSTIFYERPLRFEFILNESDLDCSIDLDALQKLLSKDLHKEAITCLMCRELVSFLKDNASKQRFSYLIQHMDSLVSNVLLSYQSYVENYTFDKVRKEYLEKRTEYVSKIHGVFDNIATKLLSLPAGIWFATTQIKEVEIGGLETMAFVKNVSVVSTVVVLAVLLIVNLIGQFSTISIMSKEYRGVFDSLAKTYEDEASEIGKAEDDIKSAQAKVEFKLYVAIGATLFLVGLTIWMFCEAYNW